MIEDAFGVCPRQLQEFIRFIHFAPSSAIASYIASDRFGWPASWGSTVSLSPLMRWLARKGSHAPHTCSVVWPVLG